MNLPPIFVTVEQPHFPGRINAIIGYNGTGKTQLLANLALVANADLGIRNRDDTNHWC